MLLEINIEGLLKARVKENVDISFTDEEIESIAQDNAKAVETWLNEEGFTLTQCVEFIFLNNF